MSTKSSDAILDRLGELKVDLSYRSSLPLGPRDCCSTATVPPLMDGQFEQKFGLAPKWLEPTLYAGCIQFIYVDRISDVSVKHVQFNVQEGRLSQHIIHFNEYSHILVTLWGVIRDRGTGPRVAACGPRPPRKVTNMDECP